MNTADISDVATFSKYGLAKPNHEKLICSFTTDIQIVTLPSRSVVSSISEINNKKVEIKLGLVLLMYEAALLSGMRRLTDELSSEVAGGSF